MPIRCQRPFSLLTAAAATMATAPALAQDPVVRDLTGFDAIEVGGNIELAVRQGDVYRVEISGSEEALEQLVTEVDGSVLIVRRHPESQRWFDIDFFDTVSVSVTLPRLTALRAAGGAEVHSDGQFAGQRLSIEANGGSDVEFDIDVVELVLQTSGGSDSTLTGAAERVTLQSSGGSDVSARRLAVAEAEVRSSGGSDVVIDVRERLLARASGGSDIDYYGNPATVDVDSSGGADITRR